MVRVNKSGGHAAKLIGLMRVNLISLEAELELVSIDYIQRLCRLVKNYPVSRTRHEIEGRAVNVIFISPARDRLAFTHIAASWRAEST